MRGAKEPDRDPRTLSDVLGIRPNPRSETDKKLRALAIEAADLMAVDGSDTPGTGAVFARLAEIGRELKGQSLQTIGQAKEFMLPKSSQAQEDAAPTTVISPELKNFLMALREVIAQKDLVLALALLRTIGDLSEEERAVIAEIAKFADVVRSGAASQVDQNFALSTTHSAVEWLVGVTAKTELSPAEVLERLLQEAGRIIEIGKFSEGFADPAATLLDRVVNALDQETSGGSDAPPILSIKRRATASTDEDPPVGPPPGAEDLIRKMTTLLTVLQGIDDEPDLQDLHLEYADQATAVLGAILGESSES